MSNMSNLVFAIQEEIELGEHSFRTIAELFDVPVHFVNQIWEMMVECEIG